MATVARIRARLLPHAVAPDPDLANLRVAARAAVMQPLVFAIGLLVLRNAQMTLFAAFAVFGLLVLANFGGRPLNRLTAYLVTTLVGGALVAVGSIASPNPWTAAPMALLVVFCIEFTGVFGGYVAESRVPLLMAFVLAASVPAPASAVPERMLGWLIGGCAATAAALVLWPLYERDVLRNAASAALRSLATLIATTRVNPAATEQHQSAVNALADLRTAYTQTAYRPGGPTRRDRALAQLVTELERARYFAVAPAHEPVGANPCLAEGNLLASAVVSVWLLPFWWRACSDWTAPSGSYSERCRCSGRTRLRPGARLSRRWPGPCSALPSEGFSRCYSLTIRSCSGRRCRWLCSWLRMLRRHCHSSPVRPRLQS